MYDITWKNATTDSLPPDEQDRLARILDDYLVAVEQGSPVSPSELFRRHPADAEHLRGYLQGLELFHAAAGLATARHPSGGFLSEVQQPGQSIDGYRLLREIGRGGMGVVYEALQTSLRRRVALKVLPLNAAHDAKQISRFKNEAQAAAQVNHPNIVPVFAVGEENGFHYYAMQLIAGKSLARVVSELRNAADDSTVGTTAPNHSRTINHPNGAHDFDTAAAENIPRHAAALNASLTGDHVRTIARLGVQAARALHAAHEYGVVHRDVKPSNLLVDDDGKLWVTDFGLARCRATSGLTQSGDILGTMRYMSPEQALGRTALVDHRTDVYSLGITLYELASLHHPADGMTDIQLFFDRSRATCKPLRHWNRHIPVDFQTIVMKAIGEFPQERYETAQALAGDLERFLEGMPIVASPPGLLNRAGKWAKRHRGAVGAAAAVLVVAFAGLFASLVLVAHQKAVTDRVNLELIAARQQESTNLRRAQENFRQARNVLDRLGARLPEQLAEIPGAEGVRLQLLEVSRGFYRELADTAAEQAADDPSFYVDLALAHSKIGDLTNEIGDNEQALQSHLSAKKLLDELVVAEPDNAEYVRSLALCQNNIGMLLAEMKRTPDALASLKRANELQASLLASSGDKNDLLSDVAVTYSNLGLVLSQTGAVEDAAKRFRDAIAVQRRLLTAADDNEVVLRGMAATYNNLASLEEASDISAATESYRAATAIQRRLIQREPLNRVYQSEFARTCNNLGSVSARAKDWKNAELYYRDAIRLQTLLEQAAPLIASYRRDLAVSQNNLGMMQSQSGRLAEAESSFREAIRLQQHLLADQPADPQMLSNLAGVSNNLALLLDQEHRFDEAVEMYLQAIDQQRQALAATPESGLFRDLLSRHYFNYARTLRKQLKPAVAAEVALERKQLWPGDPERLYSVAQELAAACRQMSESATPDPATPKYMDAAVSTLQEAIQHGLLPNRLSEKSLEVLSDTPGFQQLLTERPKAQAPALATEDAKAKPVN